MSKLTRDDALRAAMKSGKSFNDCAAIAMEHKVDYSKVGPLVRALAAELKHEFPLDLGWRDDVVAAFKANKDLTKDEFQGIVKLAGKKDPAKYANYYYATFKSLVGI